jgi:hypothetical protein
MNSLALKSQSSGFLLPVEQLMAHMNRNLLTQILVELAAWLLLLEGGYFEMLLVYVLTISHHNLTDGISVKLLKQYMPEETVNPVLL